MKKKNLIVTIPDYGNYGNRLQNYAVYKSIEDNVLNVVDTYSIQEYITSIGKFFISKIPNILGVFRIFPKEKYKTYLFWNFSNNIPTTIRCCTYNTNLERKANLIFYGSDQIWNPEFGPKICIVPKTMKDKNIALCASIGTDYIPEESVDEYKAGLLNFKHISVREERAAEIVEELTGEKPDVLIDPTLSLSKNAWIEVEQRPYYYSKKQWKNKKYIFLYFLGKLSTSRQNEIKKLAHKNGTDIIDATRHSISKYIGPSEFIWLIHHSFMVITDSYHGSILSLIFDKPFYILEREDDYFKLSMNSRFDTLFHKLDLYDRKNNQIESYTDKHDYRHSYELLEDEKRKYFAFIHKVMEEEKE